MTASVIEVYRPGTRSDGLSRSFWCGRPSYLAGAEVDVTKFEPGDDCNMIRLARVRPMAAAAVVDWLNASRQLVLCSQWPADTRGSAGHGAVRWSPSQAAAARSAITHCPVADTARYLAWPSRVRVSAPPGRAAESTRSNNRPGQKG